MKITVFEDNRYIISTPNLSGDNYSSIAQVDVYLNIYGMITVSATNHDGATGYWSESLDSIVSQLDNDTIEYLLTSLQKVKLKKIERIKNNE